VIKREFEESVRQSVEELRNFFLQTHFSKYLSGEKILDFIFISSVGVGINNPLTPIAIDR